MTTEQRISKQIQERYGATAEEADGWLSALLHGLDEDHPKPILDLSIDDLERALEFYLNPPWPMPMHLRRAHKERIEHENDMALWTLVTQTLSEPESERRTGLLEALGFGMTDPKLPQHEM